VSDAATSQLEIERKYDAGPEFVLPDLRAVPGCSAVSEPELYRLSATYFDTDDLRLMAAKVTLRRRTGGSDEGWHLKLPVRPGTRREVHLPLSDGPVPAPLASQVAEFTGGRSLRPIAVLDTDRTVRRLTGSPGPAGSPGEVLAEVADDAVTARRLSPPRTLRWREIEVELVSGQPGLLDAAGRLLVEAGARPSGSASKLGRLLAAG